MALASVAHILDRMVRKFEMRARLDEADRTALYNLPFEIRAIPALRKIPLLAVTAFAMVGDCDKILARGFDGYIAKPISPDTFVREVEAFVPLHLRSAKRSEASLRRKEPGAGRTNPRY